MAEIEDEIKAIRNARESKEILRQRGLLPNAHVPFGPAYSTRSVELTPETKNFLNFCRGADYDKKALVLDATGQYLVSPQVLAELERTIATETVMRGLCGQKNLTSDRLEIRDISEVSVGWGRLETGSDITESTPTPGAPTYAYVEDLYALSKIGEDELMDSDHDLYNTLVDSFSRSVSEAEETAIVAGAGHASQEPAGFTLDATLVAAILETTASGSITMEKLMQMIYTCPSKFRKNGTFLFNSLSILALRQIRAKDGTGTYEGQFLWQPAVSKGEPPTLLGYPCYAQDDFGTLAGTEEVLGAFGDFKRGYQILDHESGMTIQRLAELYSEAGLVGFKLHKRVGGRIVKPANVPIVLLKEAA